MPVSILCWTLVRANIEKLVPPKPMVILLSFSDISEKRDKDDNVRQVCPQILPGKKTLKYFKIAMNDKKKIYIPVLVV